MVKAALMARFQKFIVDLPSIVSQPTLVVGSQDGSRFVKATARQNVAEGYLLAHRHPERSEERRVGKECRSRGWHRYEEANHGRRDEGRCSQRVTMNGLTAKWA